MSSTKVREAYQKGAEYEKASLFSDRKMVTRKIMKAKEHISDLIGAKKETPIYFLPSMDMLLLKLIYEVLMPRAQRSGRNEILIPAGEKKNIKRALKCAGRLGLSFKEVPLTEKGQLSKEALEEAITKRTLSLLLSWSEEYAGAIQQMFDIATVCEKEDIFLFVDATDSVGKVFFRFQDSKIDMMAFSHQNSVAVVGKNLVQMKSDSWGENFCLKEFFAMAAFSAEALESMDINPMEYSLIKNEVIDRVEQGSVECVFFNKGSGYLYDRWCFAFKGVLAENLAYLLREKNIYVEYSFQEVLKARGIKDSLSRCAVSLKFSTTTSKTQIFELWDTIIETAKEIKEYSNE